MSEARRREVSAAGGRARAAAGTGHQFTSAEARAAAQSKKPTQSVADAPQATRKPRAPKHPLVEIIDWPD